MSNDSTTTRRNQRLLLGGIFALFTVAALLGAWLMERGDKKAVPKSKPTTVNIAAPGSQVSDKDAWRSQEGTHISAVDDRVQALEAKAREFEVKAKANQAALTQPAPAMSAQLAPVSHAKMPDGPLPMNRHLQSVGPQSGNSNRNTNPEPAPAAQPDTRAAEQAPPEKPEIEIETITLPKAADTTADAVKVSNKSNHLPISFGQAALLIGVDAPTGGQAQSNPLPIMLHMTKKFTLPNRHTYDAKDCFVTGSAVGDLSSERAYPRIETIGCVYNDNTTVEVPVKGYVVGEDGKVGMRGRLVTKTGQVLANALLAGVAGGIGSALSQSAQTQSISPLGTTSTVQPNAQLQAGLGQGANRGLDHMAQYYMRLADKMYPIIEIDAGRIVEVVITKGADFPAYAGADDSPFTELSKRNKRMTR